MTPLTELSRRLAEETLSARALVRVQISGTTAREAGRLNLNQRIREVEQGPDGAIWVLEDQQGGSGGRLLRLTPR